MRKPIALLVALLLAAAASPLAAYTIYLKDGSKIVAREKYRTQGERAIIVLPNGTETFIQLAQIDAARTEEANRSDYGSAVVIDTGKTKTLDPGAAAPPRDKRLADLIAERGQGMRKLPEARRVPALEEGTVLLAPGGWPDLVTFTRRPLSDPQVASELEGYFSGQGVQGAQVFQGTAGNRAFVEVPAGSEAAVFRALTVAAQALLAVRERAGNRPAALELLLTTPGRERAGQFTLTPELAQDLAGRRQEVSGFFLEHVQF
jgi:hypothetical protein